MTELRPPWLLDRETLGEQRHELAWFLERRFSTGDGAEVATYRIEHWKDHSFVTITRTTWGDDRRFSLDRHEAEFKHTRGVVLVLLDFALWYIVPVVVLVFLIYLLN